MVLGDPNVSTKCVNMSAGRLDVKVRGRTLGIEEYYIVGDISGRRQLGKCNLG